MRPVLDEVIGPDRVAVLGAKTDAGAVTKPEPPLLRLPGRDLQPFASPDALDTLVVDQPARRAQQGGDPTIAVAAVPARQLDNVGGEPLLVIAAPRRLALRRAMLTERRAHATLGDGELPPHMLDADAPTRGAQKFPEAASFRISLSSVRSATALRSRVFSVSRSFSRLT